MATVNMYNSKYEGITFQVTSENIGVQTYCTLAASFIQSYKVSINGGSFFTVTGTNSQVDIPFTCNYLGEILTLEIIPIDGGTLSNVNALYSGAYVNSIITTVLNLATNLPNLITLSSTGESSNITGNISDLPSSLVNLSIPATLTGTIADFNDNVYTLAFFNSVYNNVITGDFSDLPSNLDTFACYIKDITRVPITGNTTNLPSNLRNLYGIFGGSIVIDVDNLPSNMILIDFYNNTNAGLNTSLIGNISNLPNTLTHFRFGKYDTSTLTGDIANLPVNLESYEMIGSYTSDTNTVYGDIEDLPETITVFYISGNNTISGDIGNLNSNISFYRLFVKGLNTIGGNIENFLPTFYFMDIEGNNVISGDIGLLNTDYNSLRITGNNTISSFTAPVSPVLSIEGTFFFYITGSNTLSSTDIDNLLIYFDSITTNPTYTGRTIVIEGNSDPRTVASDTAYNSLISKSFSITLNT